MNISAFYLIPALLIAILVSIRIGLYSWKQRDVPGALPLALMALGVAWWSAAKLVFLPYHSVVPQPLRLSLQFVGSVMLPPAWLAFSYRFTGSMSRFKSGPIWGAALIGLLIVLATATDSYHHLALTGKRPGAIYLAYCVYAYLCTLWGLILMAQRMLELPTAYQMQYVIMICAAMSALVFNTLNDLLKPFVKSLDLTPIGFLTSVILIWYGLFRFRILDLVTIPQELLLNTIKDGILVIDSKSRIIEYNKAAAPLVSELSARLIGQHAKALELWPHIKDLCCTNGAHEKEIALIHHGNTQILEVRTSHFLTHKGTYRGSLLLFRDITERRKAEQQNALLMEQLRTALGEVKTLSGLLPICSSCKKIRNKAGSWESLEVYLKQNTDATLTHGLCPQCAKTLFSDFS